MKAAYFTENGPPENIIYGDLPDPSPVGSEVLVRMGAVALNPIDTYVRSGVVQMDLPKPSIVGCDVAGTVEAVGSSESRFKVGDRVWGTNQGLLGRQGTFAELLCIDERWLYPTPDNVSDEDAAASALVGITAHLGLFHRGHLQAGESVFLTGGSGGVGSMVIQMARIAGATPIITSAGNEEKAALCRELGADHTILYKEKEVLGEVMELAPNGIDLWWETVHEPDLDRAVTALARNGRIIVMAGRDARSELPIGPFYVKGASVLGFVMFMMPDDIQRACADDINAWMAAGQLKPRIDRVMSLSETADAHRLQEDNTLRNAGTLAGKIVLRP